METGIKEFQLSDVLDFQEGPGVMAVDFRNSGVPLIRLKGLETGNSLLKGCNFLDASKVASKWAHFQLQLGDVLLSSSATLGRTAIVEQSEVGSIAYTGIIRFRPKSDEIAAEYIPFLLQSPAFQEQAEQMGVGSVIRHFGPMHLRQMKVTLPNKAQQLRIAHILGTLDSKIELNRRMAATLEEMAGTIFKSWFIDFDAVRAKTEARSVSIAGDLDALVPNAFTEDGVPFGWAKRPLDSLGTFLNGLALQKYPPNTEPTLPVIKIAQLRKMDTADADRCGSNLPEEYVVTDGDILFSWSGSLECVVWTGGCGGLNQHLFKVTSEEVPDWFLYFAIHQHLPWFRSIAASKATTMGHIQRKHLAEATISFSPEVVSALSNTIEPIYNRMWRLQLESRTLAEIRDALLPKLVSGEIAVPTPNEGS